MSGGTLLWTQRLERFNLARDSQQTRGRGTVRWGLGLAGLQFGRQPPTTPPMLRTLGVAASLALCLSAELTAQDGIQRAVATGGVNVRTGQSTSSKILDHLSEGDTVTLLSAHPTKGYYHIEQATGTKGWVYDRYLTVIDSAAVTPSPVVPSGGPTGGVSSSVSSSWSKPAPQSGTFHRAGFPDCGPSGQGGDAPTNLRKNRTDEPASYHPVTFDAILAVPYPKNEEGQRSNWSATDLQVIAPFEGVGISITGFVAAQRGIIVEDSTNSSGGESTNCHAKDDPGVDWHVTIVKGKNDPKSAGIVVETTPRVRANGHPWTPSMLAAAVTDRDSVRISGWLMYDPEHFTQMTNYDPAHPYSNIAKVRATLWEIHPITKIEVFESGAWKTIP